MELLEFIKSFKNQDNRFGDLAMDVERIKFEELSETEIINKIKFEIVDSGVSKIFEDFLTVYRSVKKINKIALEHNINYSSLIQIVSAIKS
jgi:hypothetical protein